MSTENTELIVHDFNLPNQKNQLNSVEETINKLKKVVSTVIFDESITPEIHERLYEEIVVALDKAGRLSKPVMEVQDELEAMYILKYPHSPQLAKRLWYEHYEQLHHPYSILKDRCFRMLDELDVAYRDKYGKNPPNWEV
jgi:regulator of PEP synthase PpsR (kinase-PPPase family)